MLLGAEEINFLPLQQKYFFNTWRSKAVIKKSLTTKHTKSYTKGTKKNLQKKKFLCGNTVNTEVSLMYQRKIRVSKLTH